MKIKLLLSGMLGLGLALSSCNLENDDSDNYQNFTYSNVCNLVIPQSGGNAFATPDTYLLTYYIYSGTVSVTSSSISTGIGKSTFTTAPVPYTVAAYGDGMSYFEVTKFNGAQAASGSGISVTNLSGFTSQWLNFLPNSISSTMPAYPYNPAPALVISYTADYDYTVKTFAPDAVYAGTTTVSMMGAPMEPFTGKDTYYRVIFHEDLRQADVIFYNATFAQGMPPMNFVLRNLEVAYNKSGYTIQIPAGTDYIFPEMPEGQSNQFTPYKSYRFTKFNLNPMSSNLTDAMIVYDIQRMQEDNPVATFNCTFSGSYVYSESSSEK